MTNSDELDRRLLDVLGADPRLSFTDLASALGISDDAARSRFQRLANEGGVRFRGFVHPEVLGLRALATAGLRVRGPVAPVATALADVEGVTFVIEALGPDRLLIDLAGTDDRALTAVLDRVAATDGVEIRMVWRHLRVLRWQSQAQARMISGSASPQTALDQDDVTLLRVLVEDPRISFAALSAETGVPYATARRRANRLFDTGVVAASLIVDAVNTGAELRAQVGLRLNGDWAEALRETALIEDVKILVRTSGEENALAELRCEDESRLGRAVDAMAAVPGVSSLVVWTFARTHLLPIPWNFAETP